MMKSKYIITEKNRHEGEVFNYIVELSEQEFKEISEKCKNLSNNTLTIDVFGYEKGFVKSMNKKADNGYMDFMAFYKLKPNALENWKEFGDCFYKGVGLERIKD